MRRTAAFVIAGILFVTGTIGVAVATGSRLAEEEQFTLYSETLRFGSVDVPPRGFSLGDQDIVLDMLWSDAAKTIAAGRDRVVSEWLHRSHAMVQVEYSIDGRGKLFAAGTLNFSEAFLESGDDLAIVGGTGEFENVHGSVHLSVFDPETFQNDIHLLP